MQHVACLPLTGHAPCDPGNLYSDALDVIHNSQQTTFHVEHSTASVHKLPLGFCANPTLVSFDKNTKGFCDAFGRRIPREGRDLGP